MSKYIELAKKLKELADRGVGGEKQNAIAMLDSLMKKHSITMDQIEEEKTSDYFFTIEKSDKKLWHQIVKKVNYSIKTYGEFPKKLIKDYALKGNYMIFCTALEYIEIEVKYNFYKRLYSEEVDIFYSAFLKANNLLVENPNSDEEMTKEDYEEWKRINELSKKIKVGQFLKQIQ